MNEDYSIKAVFISVSLFISMIVLTLVLNYYNVAKDIAKEANKRIDIPDTFDKIMKNTDVMEDKLTGAEVQSLIRQYANEPNVSINIIAISDDPEAEGIENRINHTWFDAAKGIIRETELSNINPSWTNKVVKKVDGDNTTLELLLDYGLSE